MIEVLGTAIELGASAEEIVERYPSLGLADVHTTIAYIRRHRSETDT